MVHEFRIIQHCPCPKNLAPYIAIVTAGSTISSIYRGDDARTLLNKYGKHSQTQLYYATPAERIAWGILGQPNPPHQSTHEQYSDGVAYPGVRKGNQLAWWQIGFDVLNSDTNRVIQLAGQYHWQVWRPYSAGVEYHHLGFRVEPKPHSLFAAARILRLRETLPRS